MVVEIKCLGKHPAGINTDVENICTCILQALLIPIGNMLLAKNALRFFNGFFQIDAFA